MQARDEAMVHTRPGPHVSFDDILVCGLGLDWRGKMSNCRDLQTWQTGKCLAMAKWFAICVSGGPGGRYPAGWLGGSGVTSIILITLRRKAARQTFSECNSL